MAEERKKERKKADQYKAYYSLWRNERRIDLHYSYSSNVSIFW